MTEILVVLCGGTIGCRASNGEIAVRSGGALIVAENYRKNHDDVSFTVEEPFCILSEEITDSFYTSFVNYFRRLDLSEYDGLIITHGTDTLSFSASLFALSFPDIKIPAVFVSANRVPDDPRSNANRNFEDAVNVIKSGVRGVYSSSNGSIILASRLCESDSIYNRFTSFDGAPAMTADGGEIKINNLDLVKAVTAFDGVRPRFGALENKILLITPYPGIDYDAYDLSKCSAVLHWLYHSGTAASKELAPFIKKCREAGKAFYIAPARKGDNYTSARTMLECGALPIYRTSREAALAKLKIAYNSDNREEILGRNIYFEQL